MKPFPEKIAWDDFSFTFPAEEGGVILDKLRAVPVERLQQMQASVRARVRVFSVSVARADRLTNEKTSACT